MRLADLALTGKRSDSQSSRSAVLICLYLCVYPCVHPCVSVSVYICVCLSVCAHMCTRAGSSSSPPVHRSSFSSSACAAGLALGNYFWLCRLLC